MNLALHDLQTFQTLRQCGHTGDWAKRGIVAWAPHGLVRENACLREYVGEVVVTDHPCEMGESEAERYEVFRAGFARRLVESEVRLLFLAERNHSVLLTSDGVLKGCAESLGITCWNGDAGALARLFPMPLDPPAVQQESPLTKLSSKKISPRRQVPGRDEPMESRRRQTRGLNESRSSETMQ